MIWAFEGQLGDGKTIGAVYLAKKKHDESRTVYSNLGIGGWSRDIGHMLALKDLRNCTAVLDDIISWLDSRKSMKDVWATWLINRSRKKDVDIVYTQQVDTGADFRLRELTNVRVKTRCVGFPKFEWRFVDANDVVYKRRRVIFSDAVYELYDTREVIEQEISLDFIKALYIDVPKKSAFSHLLNSKYNIGVAVGGCIFELFEIGAFNRLPELLESHGFILGGDGSAEGGDRRNNKNASSDVSFGNAIRLRLGGS